jgi:rhamnosyltransferase
MKIAAVVILYNPSKQFTSNILTYLPFIDRLYIADNSAIATTLDNGLLSSKKVVYMHNGSNLGIAAPLNIVANKAIEEGYEWLLTMDQDSSFKVNTFENYLKKLNHLPHHEEVALVGCNFYPDKRNNPNQTPQEAQTLITSGTFINLNLF